MKNFLALLLTVFTATAFAADVKISQLPLGTAASTGNQDSFPYVASATNITKRLTIWDLINVPTIVATYAPKASPTFTGVVTAPSFVGALTGNATTATALAANPTDCSTDQYAIAIAANGNLTCASVTGSQITGTLGVANGGTGLNSGTAGGVLAFTGTTTIASSLAGSSGQILRSAGTSVPTWSTATYPATTTANQLLYSSATNTVGGLSSAATSALVTDASSVPSFTSGSTANRVLRTNGTTVSFSQVAAATDISGQLPLANGGTNANLTAAAGGVVYSGASALAITSAGTSGQYLGSNGTSAPTFKSFTAPTVSIATPVSHSGGMSANGSGTYTTPAGVIAIRVRLVGGGGGGGGSGTTGGGASSGGGGGTTSFGTSLLAGTGGGGGAFNGGVCSGGSPTLNGPAVGISFTGSVGSSGQYQVTGNNIGVNGGMGGASPFGGNGAGTFNGTAAGSGAAANSGSGGGGGAISASTAGAITGGGGCSGAYVDAWVYPTALQTFTYATGAAGTAGGAGTSGAAGGLGGAGIIYVEEFYQ